MKNKTNKKKAIYPGTFDPLTNGHLDIITRAEKIFDHVFLAIAKNSNKNPLLNLNERIMLAKQVTTTLSKVTVLGFNELITNFAKKKNINILIRGVRTSSDFNDEIQLAMMNQKIEPNLEIIFMITKNIWAPISSSNIKEIARYGGKIHQFVPKPIANYLKHIINKNKI